MLGIPQKKLKLAWNGESAPAETVEELNIRADIVKRKFEQKKATRKSVPKSERKKLKLEKLQKKQNLFNRKKAIANEIVKQETATKAVIKDDPDQMSQPKSSVFNKEGKLFFSKMKIDGEKKKKTVDTNPHDNLQKLLKDKKKIQELVEAGNKVEVHQEKQKMLWKNAFDKTEGVKVKDKTEILKKTIKRRKTVKKKSKEAWKERGQKLKDKQDARQKKREDNLNKRMTDNKKIKAKKAVKKGRNIN